MAAKRAADLTVRAFKLLSQYKEDKRQNEGERGAVFNHHGR